MSSNHNAQSGAAVSSSELVVLLGQWKQEVANLTASLASDEEMPAWKAKNEVQMIVSRRAAFSCCIADVERLMQHNEKLSDRR